MEQRDLYKHAQSSRWQQEGSDLEYLNSESGFACTSSCKVGGGAYIEADEDIQTQVHTVLFSYLPSRCAAPPSVRVLMKMPSFSRPASAPTPMPMMLSPSPSGPETHTYTVIWEIHVVEIHINRTQYYFFT